MRIPLVQAYPDKPRVDDGHYLASVIALPINLAILCVKLPNKLVANRIRVSIVEMDKHAFTCIVACSTGCGKNAFVTPLLRFASSMIDIPCTLLGGKTKERLCFRMNRN